MTAPQTPSATRALRVLRFLAQSAEPAPLEAIARAVQIPRSSAYHLVKAMIAEGFLTHVEDEHRYALGLAAFEVGTGYLRHEPLQRLARRPLAQLVDELGESAHLAVLHGRETFYVIEERAPRRPPLVSDTGVRLPAQITASGRAILAYLAPAQLRALFSESSAFVSRHGTGPRSLSALHTLLAAARRRGYATEDGEVTPGLSSIAYPVLDHSGYPVASVAVTFGSNADLDRGDLVRRTAGTAAALSRRLGGTPRA